MTRQSAHAQRERDRGCVFRSIKLEPPTVAALAKLRERYASDAAAVNAAVVFMSEHCGDVR